MGITVSALRMSAFEIWSTFCAPSVKRNLMHFLSRYARLWFTEQGLWYLSKILFGEVLFVIPAKSQQNFLKLPSWTRAKIFQVNWHISWRFRYKNLTTILASYFQFRFPELPHLESLKDWTSLIVSFVKSYHVWSCARAFSLLWKTSLHTGCTQSGVLHIISSTEDI